MDFINHNDTWDWQGGDYYCFEDNSSFGESSIAFGVRQSADQSYMFSGETTPVKACSDLAYYASNNESMSKGLEECREPSSRAKRRRLLQFDSEVIDAPHCNEGNSFDSEVIDPLHCDEGNSFDSEVIDAPHCNEGNSSTHPRSNEMGDSVEEALSEMSRWLSDDSDGTSICGSEALNQLFEGWISNCLNDAEMKFSPEDMDMSGQSDVQNNRTELCNKPTGCEAKMVQARPVCTHRNVIFKGRKSYMQTPKNLASSVVYPFAFVKPCSFNGDVTLKDFNQRINAPRYMQIKEDPVSYPTSAFSGKPVVAKTRICTEGGKGSITIMRTKG